VSTTYPASVSAVVSCLLRSGSSSTTSNRIAWNSR
jgi:hypothetical protein